MRVRRLLAVGASGALAFTGLAVITGPAGAGGTPGTYLSFDEPTAGDDVTVPDGVCGAYVAAYGAQGGHGTDAYGVGAAGGLGGGASGWVPLTPAGNIEVRVGGEGGDGVGTAGDPNGGLNGGGDGAPSSFSTIYGGGGGGGYSGIFVDGNDNLPLIVAGGGGGGGITDNTPDYVAGEGGDGSGSDGTDGGDGLRGNPPVTTGGGGKGGTDTTGGAGGVSADDTDFNGLAGGSLAGGDGGGDPNNDWGYGGGGGGGYYGGGGGADSFYASGGGGGGSGLVPDVMGGSSTAVQEGDGAVDIYWTPCAAEVSVQKTVTGDDPGVAFPVEVTCQAVFASDVEGPVDEGADIVLTLEESSGSTTVEVKNGEEASVVVAATAYVDTLDCTATEQAATLPTGYTCDTPSYVPDNHPYFWDQGIFVSDSEPVEVVNPCAKVVELKPNFTG